MALPAAAVALFRCGGKLPLGAAEGGRHVELALDVRYVRRDGTKNVRRLRYSGEQTRVELRTCEG